MSGWTSSAWTGSIRTGMSRTCRWPARWCRSTPGCSTLSASGRVVSLRAQPLSGSRSPRSPARAGGLQPYVSAILGSWPCSALCASLNALGFTHRSLRAQVNHLLGGAMHAYTSNQMSYDLGRLRLNGIIERLEGTNTYQLTAEGNVSRSSTPRSTIGYCVHCSPPTPRRHRSNYARRCTQSTGTCMATSTTPGWETPPENSRPTSEFGSPRNATPRPGLRPEAVAPSGQLWSRVAGCLTFRRWSMNSVSDTPIC